MGFLRDSCGGRGAGGSQRKDRFEYQFFPNPLYLEADFPEMEEVQDEKQRAHRVRG